MFESKRNGYLAYNGLNNSFVKINENLFDLLKKAKNDIELLNEIDTEIKEILKTTLMVCSEEDIQVQINQKRFLRYYNAFQNDYLNLTIAPTSFCNFKCSYCYEEGIPYKTMDDITIEKLIDFIAEKSKKTQNNIDICWYGGEPLLAVKQIDKILKGIAEKKINILWQSIVTNGYFLTAENFEFLKKNKIDNIQITLDGSNAETHNKRRKSKDGSGSWERILENIDNILSTKQEVRISIRCNVGKGNQAEYPVLKEYLEKRWNNNPNISIHPGILRNHNDENGGCQYFSNVETSDFLIHQGVQNKDLSYLSYVVGGCSATQYNAYLIGPEGELYKCWNELGLTDRIIGNVNDKLEKNKNLLLEYLSGQSMLDDEKCKNCCLLFTCTGGCQWSRINNKRYNKNDDLCHFAKINMEKYLEEYYELKQSKSEPKNN